jgi:hypothetical protein
LALKITTKAGSFHRNSKVAAFAIIKMPSSSPSTRSQVLSRSHQSHLFIRTKATGQDWDRNNFTAFNNYY